jgi:predicted unusual protein kinase regulating ubiquinone biosynthesis (AarF/ABC1/UbiB family)
LIDILVGVLDADAEAVMNTLSDLGALVLPDDPSSVRRSIQYFLSNLGERPDRENTVSVIGEDLFSVSRDQPFRLPANSIFLLRALSTIEGVNKSLDPDFEFSKAAKPFSDEILRGRRGGSASDNSARGLLRTVADAVLSGNADAVTEQVQKRVFGAGANAVQAVGRIQKMEKTLGKLENGDLKVRATSLETERLLNKQFALAEASNLLMMAGVSAVLATQAYSAGGVFGFDAAAVLSSVSGLFGIMYARKSRKISREARAFRSRK